MSKTMLSQYQISGSHVVQDVALANRGKHDSLMGELNDLRSALKSALGSSNYYDDAAIDLSTIKGEFDTTLNINSASLAGDLTVLGHSQFTAGVEVLGDLLEVGSIQVSATDSTIVGLQMNMADGSTAVRKDYVDTAVSTEASTARSAELSLEVSISVEASTARSAEASLESALSTEIVNRVAAVSTEASTARAAETSLESAISVEASTARSAEASLESALSTEIVNRVAAVSTEASTARSAEASLESALSTEIVNRVAAVSTEASTARAAETSLESLISVEASTARSAEASLEAGLSTEIVNRVAAVSTEASTARAAELSLETALSVEASTARSAEASLESALSTEIVNRVAAVSTEASTARAAELSLETALSVEASTARAAELSLETALSVEASTARSAEGSLEVRIGNEETRAASVEAVLSTELSNEVDRAESAEASLDAYADGIVAGDFNFNHINVDNDVMIGGNLQVAGNFNVQGAFTYVETENLKVKDAFIHLATGSVGGTDSGIVLHMGNGNDDLVIGQSAGNGTVLFGSQADVGQFEGAADISAMDLVPVAAYGVQMGATADNLIGGIHATGAGNIKVESAADLQLYAAADLTLTTNGAAWNFAAVNEVDDFVAQFGEAATVIGAINSLSMGSNYKKGVLAPAAAQRSLDFTDVGALRASYDQGKDLDVYLNGVLMVAGDDFNVATTTSLVMEFDFQAGDKVTVVIRNAAI